VVYNNETYILTKKNANGTWQIYDPNKTGHASKKSVAERNLTMRKEKARVVGYNSGNYLVTPNNSIISLTTNKLMMWAENDPQRLGVLSSKERPYDEPQVDNHLDFDCDAPF
jgi:hypothetical protein